MTCRVQFYPSTVWVSGIKHRQSGCTANPFTPEPSLQPFLVSWLYINSRAHIICSCFCSLSSYLGAPRLKNQL